MAIFFNFLLTSSHLHPLQVENCGSNSRRVVDEDDNGKLRIERVKCNLYENTFRDIIIVIQSYSKNNEYMWSDVTL